MGSFRPLRGVFQPDEVKLLQAAFDATWADIITHNPSREFDADKLKHEITETLCALAVAGITDPAELQALTIASLEL
jgi:hypothetical protein